MKKKSRSRKPGWQKSIAKERITTLFREAGKVFKEKPEYSHRYVSLAREIGMRYRVHVPKEFKRQYCKKCKHYLRPGVNCTVRLNQKRFSKIIIKCNDCGFIKRIPYKK